MLRLMFGPNLVVPGGDAVKAVVLVQQVEGLAQEAADSHQTESPRIEITQELFSATDFSVPEGT